MGLYVKIGWKMAEQDPKVWNSDWWRHIELLFHFEVLKKVTSTIIFLWIDVFKSKVSKDLDENWLDYRSFVTGVHLEFLRHFKVLFLKIHTFFFLWSRLPTNVIRSTLNLIAHEMTIALPLFNKFWTVQSNYWPQKCQQ
jgi:hypothetical protein